MLNFYYMYSILWSVTLILYMLQWSNMCMPIEPLLLLFIIVSIVVSAFLGKMNNKYFQYVILEENPHKSSSITLALICLYILTFIYSRKIPLLNVLQGMSYQDIESYGIPHLNLFIVVFSMYYAVYLAYIFALYKEKKVLMEIFVIVSYFLLTVQRQHILIIVILAMNILLAKRFNKFIHATKRVKRRIIFFTIVGGIVLLYGAGVMGNMRYGSMFAWNDSWMIMSLGEANENFPSFIPGEFFWSYIYLVSPLANLNYNFREMGHVWDIETYIIQYIPSFLSNKTSFIQEVTPVIHDALNVATAYARPYMFLGTIGVLIAYMMYMIAPMIVLRLCYQRNRKMLVVVCNALLYFLMLTFFSNSFAYAVTSLFLFISLLIAINFNIKIKIGRLKRIKVIIKR